MKYSVKVIERHSGIFEVEAGSEDEAIAKDIDLCNEQGGAEYERLESAEIVR